MKVWLELAVKNIKDIQNQVKQSLSNVDIQGAVSKARGAAGAGGSATDAAANARNLTGMGKGIGKIAMTIGAVLGALYVIGKTVKAVLNKMIESSPYLQGVLSVLKRATQLFWRPFGDFLATALRPLAIMLMKAAVKWLGFTRTEEGEGTVGAIAGIGAGAAAGAGVGAIVGGIGGGPIGAFIGAGVGGVLGGALSLLDEAFQGAKNLAYIASEWLDYLAFEVFGIDMTKIREAIAKFIHVTVPEFFTKTLPDWFSKQASKLGDFGSWIWEKITSSLADTWSKISQFGQWFWGQITAGLGNVMERLRQLAQWIWDKITGSLSNTYTKLSGIGQWLYNKITGGLSNVKDWMSNIGSYLYGRITRSIKNAFENFKFGWSWWWSKDAGNQKGLNFVPETGLYKLHRGETVTTAARAEKTGGGNVFQISPVFNISGNNGNVESQVRSAARLLEFEVRRRQLL